MHKHNLKLIALLVSIAALVAAGVAAVLNLVLVPGFHMTLGLMLSPILLLGAGAVYLLIMESMS